MSPVDRPLALGSDGLDCTGGAASRQIGAPNASPSSRVSTRQIDAIARNLSDVDLQVLRFVQVVRLATGGQLRRRFWQTEEVTQESNARMARRTLGRLAQLRVLDRLPRSIGGVRAGSEGFVYHLGPVGLRLLARMGSEPKRLGAPGDRYIRHTLAITQTVVGLHEADRRGQLDLIEVQTEPTCWRGFIAAAGARVVLKPDLFLRIGAGAMEDRWFVEIDLSTEARGTLIRKATRYLDHYRSGFEQRDHGIYPRVLWVAPDDRRVGAITSALGSLPAEAWHLFTVCRQDDLLARLAAEASS